MFCTTGLPSDIEIEVDDMTFHLHKFPLMSKSGKLHLLITEQETKSFSSANLRPSANLNSSVSAAEDSDGKGKRHEIEEEEQELEEEEEEEAGSPCIKLHNFPGGSETFELVAKFCYGVKIDLSGSNAAPLRCAAEHLEMTEGYSPENLISKAERFLSTSVFKSLRESVKALKSCESVSGSAESLGITDRCIESIVSRASSVDPSLFGWPVNDGGGGGEGAISVTDPPLLPGDASKQADSRRKKPTRDSKMESWFEDLAQLSLPVFNRVISAMRSGDLSPDIIESCLMCYAKKHIPGILRSNRKPQSSSSTAASENEQRELLETVTSNLPLDKSSRSATTRFLFGLLRTAIILNASEACRNVLERKIGSQLEQATLDDLLIPSYSYLNETLYDVDLVERILGYFLDTLEQANAAGIEVDPRSPSLMLVGKLIDGYLAEIASDANLKPEKFYNLAISLPDQARLYDDGLYRAVDVYLKAHPWITEAEREKICGVMDCQKLTLEACTHAAQNERLPLRAVVQVLFFEQLQLRQAIAGTLLAAQTPSPSQSTEPRQSERRNLTIGEAVREEEREGEGGRWRETVRENQVLKLDMDTMRTRVHRLERECSNMKKVIATIDKDDRPRGGGGGWSITKRFGCKFKTQVCDSQEATMVDRTSRRS
ncbi:PREDICTED: BTB/POZ domain-containing protein At5g66560 isoform X2 [Tarenaya hassleriana]|uniref:BTB/POZ domain-containing protein At5g66560 isoform X2 n=1 Tax=Tarenaya hassleriana TaxID=28532 RepID=UPI00053C0DB9|nr:PREDICTED: BTB/POZ domain-containing protein At5g66560 isoform X2 [Tarenaya hassleriana]